MLKTLQSNIVFPFSVKISFNKLLNQYDQLAKSENALIASKANEILNVAKQSPVLRDGFTDLSYLNTYDQDIRVILQDVFSHVLTLNEIKFATVPLGNAVLASTQRFKNIVKDAGDNFDLLIKNMPEEDLYIFGCTIIISMYYGYTLNFKRPIYYDIPDKNGILKTKIFFLVRFQ